MSERQFLRGETAQLDGYSIAFKDYVQAVSDPGTTDIEAVSSYRDLIQKLYSLNPQNCWDRTRVLQISTELADKVMYSLLEKLNDIGFQTPSEKYRSLLLGLHEHMICQLRSSPAQRKALRNLAEHASCRSGDTHSACYLVDEHDNNWCEESGLCPAKITASYLTQHCVEPDFNGMDYVIDPLAAHEQVIDGLHVSIDLGIIAPEYARKLKRQYDEAKNIYFST